MHVSDTLLTDAENLRAHIGDEEFLARLGGGSGGDDGWGGLLGAGWDLPRYQAALSAPAEDSAAGNWSRPWQAATSPPSPRPPTTSIWTADWW